MTLAIAYHNMGVEEEFLKNLQDAVHWYEKSFAVMDENSIEDENLYKRFKKCYVQA